MNNVFFDDWPVLLRTLAVGVPAYIALVVFLRIAGKRILSKMNAFDLVITISLGSTLASILLSKDVSLVQGLLALALLIALQFVISWTSVRARWVRRGVTGEPALLLHRGTMLPRELRRVRVTEDEVLAALRSAGLGNVDQAEAVVLETDGSFSVIPRENGPGGGRSSLEGLVPESASNQTASAPHEHR